MLRWLVLAFAAGLFYVWQQTRVIEQTYQMRKLEEELAAVSGTHARAKLELETRLQSNRLEALAASRLGMVKAGSQNTIELK